VATLPAYRRHRNVELTVQALIGNSLSVASLGPDGVALALTVPVYHGDTLADPDEARRPGTVPAPRWIECAWLSQGAGRRGVSTWQVDCRTRIGAPGDTDADPFGHVCDDIADHVEALFAGARDGVTDRGTLLAWVPMYDYAIIASPVRLPSCIFVQTLAGAWGVPEERRKMPPMGGFNRVVLRFSMRLTQDAVRNGWYAETPA